METFKKVSFTVLLLVFLIVTIGFLLPRKIHVSRSKVMKADAAILFEQVNTIRNWKNWSPWDKLDTSMRIEYYGTSGKGAGYSWKSTNSKIGNGNVEILNSNQEDTIQVLLSFMPEVPAWSTFAFLQDDRGLVINWTIDFEMNKNPFLRYLGLFMDKWIGRDFEQGLIQLDSAAMDEAALHPPLRIELKEVPPFAYIYLERKTTRNEVSENLEQAYALLLKQITNPGIQMAGAPFARYTMIDSLNTIVRAGIPVQPWFRPGPKVKLDTSNKVKALVGYYYGPYSGISSASEKLIKYSRTHHYNLEDYSWESYVTDPTTEPDSSKWLTELFFPVKE
ncbi:MAG: hypothetical protein U0T82_10080 [Bacteroidales bacterium]